MTPHHLPPVRNPRPSWATCSDHLRTIEDLRSELAEARRQLGVARTTMAAATAMFSVVSSEGLVDRQHCALTLN